MYLPPSSFSGRPGRWLVALGLALIVIASPLPARDAFVLLSGGGTPLTNNYSQYLQAREMTAHLQRSYPADSVWVFFGIGNRPGEAAKLADVRKQVKEKGFIRETWLPGPLPNNRPARKADFLKALREEILPAVHDGGTLYLFIGDHGALAKNGPKESIVTMWQLENTDGKERGWRTNPEEELSVTDLRSALDAGLGQGRVVFCMTQCHSGGFHYLGVPRALLPPTEWFTAVPDWAMPLDHKPLPLAAGFTAVDEESLAAGCDPDPDPDRWAGYERFVPEALLGVDMFSGKIIKTGLPSYAAAHEASVLVDQTIDKPRSTSEQYLERWATLIEKLAGEKNLVPEAAHAVAAYQKAVDGGLAEVPDAAFAAKRALFERYVQRMTEQNKSAAALLQSGARAELEKAIGVRPAAGGGQTRRPVATGTAPNQPNPWKDTIRPAWKAAVEGKKVKGLKGDALAFEKYLLAQEDKGRNLFSRGWQNPILNDIFWQSGYPFPAKLNTKKAEAVTRWGAMRREKIGQWARSSKDPKVKEAAGKFFPARRNPRLMAAGNPPLRTLSTKIAAERALFYRRTLGAWAFLLTVKAEPALAELHALIALENTPLPVPVARSEAVRRPRQS